MKDKPFIVRIKGTPYWRMPNGDLVPVIMGGMALPATDDFTTGSDQDLSSKSDWTSANGDMRNLATSDDIHSNSGSTEILVYWNADTFANDQKSKVTLVALSTDGAFIGSSVRVSTTAATGYAWYTNSNNSYLWKLVNGSWSQLDTNGSVPAVNSVVEIFVTGSGSNIDLSVEDDGTEYMSSDNDDAIASGYAGVAGYGVSSAIRADNFSADDISTGITVTPSAVSCIAGSASPTVVLGSTSVTPAARTAVASSVNPTVVIGGDVTVTPTPCSGIGTTVAPTVVLGSISIAPSSVSSIASTVIGDVWTGEDYWYPDSDLSSTNWINELGQSTNLYQSIDEATPNDSDYIRSQEDPGSYIYEASLQDPTDPSTSFGHKVYYRYRKEPGPVGQVDMVVRLKQNTTTIASWTHLDVPATWTDGEGTLTSGEADSITDYSALRIEIEAY